MTPYLTLTGEKPAKSLHVFMLGRFQVAQGDIIIESNQWRNRKARSLFKILLARRNFQISRQEVAELLWPELDQDRISNNLNQTLYSLRRILEPTLQKASDSSYISVENSKIQLNSALIGWIDVEEFKRLARQAQITADLNLYEQAATLYQGDYLPDDLYEDWSVSQREALRQTWIELLTGMADLYHLNRYDDKYEQCLYRILESDFSHELTVQKLITRLASTGRTQEALGLYSTFATKLQNRLHLEPLPQTRKLYDEIAAGKFTVKPGPSRTEISSIPAPSAITTPAFRSTARVRISPPRFIPKIALPKYSARTNDHEEELVGRVREQGLWQQNLQAALEGRPNLLVLVGEAGVGKTALVKQLVQITSKTDFFVLTINCSSGQSELPYAGICELLEQCLYQMDSQELQECWEFFDPELQVLLANSVDTGLNLELIKASRAYDLFVITAQVMAWLGRKHHLALFFDDLINLSSLSLRLLNYILTHPNLLAPVVLGTLRPISAKAFSPELTRLLNWSNEFPARLHSLNRLYKEELALLVRRRFNQELTATPLNYLYECSQGNPYIALDLMQNRFNPNLPKNEEPIYLKVKVTHKCELPPSVVSYITRVVSEISPEGQVLLNLAALVGPIFKFELIHHLITHHRDGSGWWIQLDKTRLGSTLDELTARGLVEEQGVEYHFAYPLLAEVLASSLSHNQRHCWLDTIKLTQKQLNIS